MTYYPKPAPKRKVYHRSWRTGYVVNSSRGAGLAKRSGAKWVDNDHHLSKNGEKFVNAHGAPETFWLKRGQKFEDRTWAALSKLTRKRLGRTYRLRSGGQTLRDNAAAGINTEFEVKDVHPVTHAQRLVAFHRLAVAAQAAYGKDWRAHVVVKVLSNLGGGLSYALAICGEAHDAGFPTMILARGAATRERFAGHSEVTWVRGSKAIR